MSDAELKFKPVLYTGIIGELPLGDFPDKAHISHIFKEALKNHCEDSYEFLGLEAKLCCCKIVPALTSPSP